MFKISLNACKSWEATIKISIYFPGNRTKLQFELGLKWGGGGTNNEPLAIAVGRLPQQKTASRLVSHLF